ncbi:hypothetical protein PV721_43545 [Streptomyces sp. MB09-01]|uniref:hypothetical protein n=1 Tax=Streptomyces sp. MB09-01 TaxID=3028666 RepID=UPI0029A6952B|nr:hypothetical protein [Streptomyces sp. MB09-01]MDX3541036.1 hypothetical protein [Streptomyces sp. MB09-01]
MTHYNNATVTIGDQQHYGCSADIVEEPATANAIAFSAQAQLPALPQGTVTLTFDSEDDASAVEDALTFGGGQGWLDLDEDLPKRIHPTGAQARRGPELTVRFSAS